MSEQRTIHFHVGAHKTATTYMQSRLRANQEQLRASGIDFVDLWAKGPAQRQYRNTIRRLLEEDVLDTRALSQLSAQLRDLVASQRPDPNNLAILSFENILGGFDLTRSRTPYPHAAAAIRHVLEAFGDYRVRIFLAIRSLDRFLESGYVQRVSTRRETRTFKRYLNQVDVPALSWVPLVRAVQSVVTPEDLNLWKYEGFFSDEPAIWNALLRRSDAETVLTNPAKKTNESLSAKGLKYLRSINKVATPADARKFRFFVKESFGPHLGLKPPKLLSDARRKLLIANYERDCDELTRLLNHQV